MRVDISSVVLPVLASKLAKYREDLICLADIDNIYKHEKGSIEETISGLKNSRDRTMSEVKEIIQKMGYILGEADSEKTKAETITSNFKEFLRSNESTFEEAIDLFELSRQPPHQ